MSNNIQNLQVPKCRSLLVERTYTTGFIITADQYDDSGTGPFTTTLHVSYPSGAGKNISIVQYNTIGSDICVRDAILDQNGNVNIADYDVAGTHMIYAILKSVIVGNDTIQCCSSPIDYINCPYSNSILFTVSDLGNIQFLSNPSGAQIWLAQTGQTPTDSTRVTPDTILSLPIGDYDYILKLTNFNDYTSIQPITVLKDQTAIVGPIDLVPAEGCIYFISTPPGARIFLNSTLDSVVDTGFVTPKLICGLNLGQHCYKLVLSGYEDKTGCITLGTGEGNTTRDTLVPSCTPNWQCEQPLNGYEEDLNNCSSPNRRVNQACMPVVQAGFNEKERILAVGLLFGLLNQAMKKYREFQQEKLKWKRVG